MPPNEMNNTKALALLRRTGTEPVMSLVKIGASTQMASAMTRMILKNIHLSLISRKKQENVELNSTENGYAPEQRDGEEPVLKWVRVAVKPDPEKKAGGAFADESSNWEANSKKWEGGLGAQSKRGSRDKKPAFILKEVPYADWRKHYAKDKYGKYRGTEAPAENCILIPEDEIKWRSEKAPVEAEQSAPSENDPPFIAPLQRSATLPPEMEEVNTGLLLRTDQATTIPTEKEEAIFIEDDGHTESRIVDEPKIKPASPTSLTTPTSPIFLSPPTSPLR